MKEFKCKYQHGNEKMQKMWKNTKIAIVVLNLQTLTLIRLGRRGQQNALSPWYILLYNNLATDPNFMKFGNFFLNLSGIIF